MASRDPLTIVHVVAPAVAGGTESVIRGLAIGHHRQGLQVHVVGVVEPRQDEHPYLRSLSDAGVQVHALNLPARAYLRERRLVRDILEACRPDVLHTHGFRPDILDAPLARRLGIPTVTTLHGSSMMGTRTGLYEWLQLRQLKRFSAVVAVSRPLAIELEAAGVPASRVHYIQNGWVPSVSPLARADARASLGLEREDLVVGWVARLIPVKACDVFLRALAHCRGLPLKAAIVGDGPERAALETLTAELGLQRQVRFCGARQQAGQFFSAFDVFVLSSRSEGTPMTLLEAMAVGVPIVSTAVGGVPHVVTPLEALLVAPEDPAALGLAIQQCVGDPAAGRTRAAAATRRLASDFGAEKWLASHEALYRRLRR